MRWSKLKARVKERICPELRQRVDFHATSYRHSHDEAEKVWVTIDGVRLATYSWYQKQFGPAERDDRGRLVRRNSFMPVALPKGDPAWDKTAKMHLPQDFGDAMRVYLDLKIQEALKSPDPIVRAFALIDRRCGKRSLHGTSRVTGDSHARGENPRGDSAAISDGRPYRDTTSSGPVWGGLWTVTLHIVHPGTAQWVLPVSV